jgi:hypothetical protein
LAFERKPDVGHHAILAWVLIAGDLDAEEGIELAEKAMAMPLGRVPIAELRARCFLPSAEQAAGLGYLNERRFQDAVAVLEKAAELQPRRALVAEHLAAARGSM